MIFNHVATKILSRQIDFVNDIFYLRLVSQSQAQSQSIQYVSNIIGEATGGNYTPKMLTQTALPQILSNNNTAYIADFGSATWLALMSPTITNLTGVVMCKSATGTTFASTDLAILYLPFPDCPNSPGGVFYPDASDLYISVYNSAGIIKITV